MYCKTEEDETPQTRQCCCQTESGCVRLVWRVSSVIVSDRLSSVPLVSVSGAVHLLYTRRALSLSSHSSVLVDMGKVVGLLRSYPLHGDLLDDELAAENGTGGDEGDDVSDFELSDETQCSESNSLCASCAKEVKGEESEDIEDSLFGDPLVYATFVATVQQYSTETEPSRQPSVISRNPSFKQNSCEPDTPGQPGQADKSEVMTSPDESDREYH